MKNTELYSFLTQPPGDFVFGKVGWGVEESGGEHKPFDLPRPLCTSPQSAPSSVHKPPICPVCTIDFTQKVSPLLPLALGENAAKL